MEVMENQNEVSHRSHRSLEISPTTRDSHFPTAPTAVHPKLKSQNRSRWITTKLEQMMVPTKPDIFDLLTRAKGCF